MSMQFLREFFREPKSIGAVAPSGRSLARTIVSGIDIEQARVIVEYGPGTGVFTREILRRKQPEAEFFAVEQNGALAAILRQRFPGVRVFEDSVEHLPALLSQSGCGKVDCIVSGLPWAAFDSDLQNRLLRATLDILADGGRFTTFAYLQGLILPAGLRFKRLLAEHFCHVGRSAIVWRNLPPAFAYRCVK